MCASGGFPFDFDRRRFRWGIDGGPCLVMCMKVVMQEYRETLFVPPFVDYTSQGDQLRPLLVLSEGCRASFIPR